VGILGYRLPVLQDKVELDEEWAENHTEQELVDYLRDSYATNLGYRAAIKRFQVVKE